jgi:tetratricopeptide (TPR) repeat protein
MGDADGAREEIEAALALIGEGQWIWGEATAHYLLGIFADFTGETGRAEEEYRRCLEIRERLGAREGVAVVQCALGALLLEQDRPEEARAELEAANATAIELRIPATAVLCSVYLALLPGGDTAAAREALRNHAERIGPPTVMEARFMLYRADGDPADLEEAYRILCETRDLAPEEFRDSLIENVPANRELRSQITSFTTRRPPRS